MSTEATTEQPTTPTEGSTSTEAGGETLLSSTETPTTTEQQNEAKPEGEKPTEENKPTEEAKVEGAPEKYEFTAPEGQTYDPAVIDSFSEAAKEANLTQETASKIVEKMVPAIQSRLTEQVKATAEAWATETRNDKDFGGDKLKDNLALAKKGAEFLGGDFSELLDKSGFGNNLVVLRSLAKVGKSISEDTFVAGRPAPLEPADRANRLFDKTK